MEAINNLDFFWWIIVLVFFILSIFDIKKYKWKSNENSSNVYDNSRIIGSVIMIVGIIISVIVYLFTKK
jgi:uncharacterized membrane protein